MASSLIAKGIDFKISMFVSEFLTFGTLGPDIQMISIRWIFIELWYSEFIDTTHMLPLTQATNVSDMWKYNLCVYNLRHKLTIKGILRELWHLFRRIKHLTYRYIDTLSLEAA